MFGQYLFFFYFCLMNLMPSNISATLGGITAEMSQVVQWMSETFADQERGERRGPKSVVSPIGSMYGICTYIYPKNGPNVGKYSIHGAYGI